MSLVYGLLCGLSFFAAATKWRNYICGVCDIFFFFLNFYIKLDQEIGGIGPVWLGEKALSLNLYQNLGSSHDTCLDGEVASDACFIVECAHLKRNDRSEKFQLG